MHFSLPVSITYNQMLNQTLLLQMHEMLIEMRLDPCEDFLDYGVVSQRKWCRINCFKMKKQTRQDTKKYNQENNSLIQRQHLAYL